MTFAWFKHWMPRGLYGRAALILVVPVVAIQLVVSFAFIQRHFEDVTRQMTQNVALEIAYLDRRVRMAADAVAAGEEIGALVAPLSLDVTLPALDAPASDERLWYDLSGRVVTSVLRERLEGLVAVDLARSTREVRLRLSTPHGDMGVVFDRRRVSASNPHQLLVLMGVTSLLMTLIAYLFLRNQLRPIKRLAAAAEAFGKGRHVAYKPTGANEVRAAGAAFLDMRARIERQIEQRTLMLSGVSHDLRTPLTRLRLGLSMLDEDPEIDAMKGDLTDMERLLDAFLDFARGDSAYGEPEPTDPAVLVAGIVEDARRAGQDVLLAEPGEGGHSVMLRRVAIKRAVENLIGNAVRYGKRAEVRLSLGERALKITVEDDGPGIPRSRREEALRPFSRLDPARNQDRGTGVGLGLSIAMDIARSHGGTLRLGESEHLGGLKAELVLAL